MFKLLDYFRTWLGKCLFFLFAFSFKPRGTHYYCVAAWCEEECSVLRVARMGGHILKKMFSNMFKKCLNGSMISTKKRFPKR